VVLGSVEVAKSSGCHGKADYYQYGRIRNGVLPGDSLLYDIQRRPEVAKHPIADLLAADMIHEDIGYVDGKVQTRGIIPHGVKPGRLGAGWVKFERCHAVFDLPISTGIVVSLISDITGPTHDSRQFQSIQDQSQQGEV
jgi:hypothetical protein